MQKNQQDKIQIVNNREEFLKLEKFLLPIHLTKTLIIKDLKFDQEFSFKLYNLLKKEKKCLKELEITNCQFLIDTCFAFVGIEPYEKLTITHCNLNLELIKEIISDIDIYNIIYLNFSNNLINDEKLFFEFFDECKDKYFSNFRMNISNNPICKKISDKENKNLIINK